jgi:hypothetical protein
MSYTFDRDRSLEQLDGQRWPDPGEDATSLVTAIHSLRRRPVGCLTAEELARLIGQNVGLHWLLPLALEILREDATRQSAGGFFDDDLLTAVLTRDHEAWRSAPELARGLREILGNLTDLGSYIEPDARKFLEAFPG